MSFLGVALLVIGLWTGPIVKGQPSTLYQCRNSAGAIVFSDSPAQLNHCVPLDQETLAPRLDEVPNLAPMTGVTSRPFADPSPQAAWPEHRPAPSRVPVQPGPPFEPSPPDDATPATLPLTRIGDALLVQVLLNQTHYAHMMVDIGASMTVLSPELAGELGIGSDSGQTTHVREIRAGLATARNVPVIIQELQNPLPGVSGWLGQSFLNQFDVTLEAERGMLHLQPRP